MTADNFLYQTYCELLITSDSISLDSITAKLGILPSRTFQKGEQSISKYSGSVVVRPHNLWALRSPIKQSENETIKDHFDFFKEALSDCLRALEDYKHISSCEVIFNIWIETDNAGVGLDLDENQIAFLARIANHVKFSLISNTE